MYEYGAGIDQGLLPGLARLLVFFLTKIELFAAVLKEQDSNLNFQALN